MDPKLKRKGRALSAAKSGLRQAREDLIKADRKEAAENCTRSLRRSERLDHHVRP
jgi:Tfp pilus assembly protein PilX